MIRHERQELQVYPPESLTWYNDGEKGPQDTNTSISMLFNWWTTHGNYSKYRGGTENNGKTKLAICGKVAAETDRGGVRVKRTAKMVSLKIQYLEKCMRSAIDWTETETGANLQDGDPHSFEDAV